jgi:putative sugar O-methyltransferase
MISYIKKQLSQRFNLYKANQEMVSNPLADLKFLENGLCVKNEESGSDDKVLVMRLIDAYHASKEFQKGVALPYQPGGQWQFDINARRSEYLAALNARDIDSLSELLSNFLRNSGIAGLWRYAYFDEIKSAPISKKKIYINQLMRDIKIVSDFVDGFEIPHLAMPVIGNPWGYLIDGILVWPTASGHYLHATHVSNLIRDIEYPIAVEIGGGFGGFAQYLISRDENVKFISFDLPEIILIQQYFLMKAFPEKNFLLYGEEKQKELSPEILDKYDLILMPNFSLPDLADRVADIFVNVHSLSEMDYHTVEEYIHQITRTTKQYFLHENSDIAKMNQNRGGFVEVVSKEFPVPKNEFKRIYKHNSPFGTRYREHLYQRIAT